MHFKLKTPKKTKYISMLLVLAMIASVIISLPSLQVKASSELTSIALAEYGLQAYRDGWIYNYGSKGEASSSGTRMSDCSGLIYAFFTDNGTTGPRRASEQTAASVHYHEDINTIPRIHGLLVSNNNDDHIGIYIGNNIAVDNSDYGTNMRYGDISGRDWIYWNMLDAGVKYPTNGFYAFDGNMYHYTDRQYDINTTIEYDGITYSIGSDGIICDLDGNPIPVDPSMPNDGYASAQQLPAGPKPEGTITAEINATNVRMRLEASTSSAVVAMLSKGNMIYVYESVQGENIISEGTASTTWYKCITPSGKVGYITSHYVTIKEETPAALTAPSMSYKDSILTMTANNENVAIYYTVDGTVPSESNGYIYTDPIVSPYFTTYRAVAIDAGRQSTVSSASVFSNGKMFTDITNDQWYYEYVEQALNQGIFSGYDNYLFMPDKGITRAEFVTVLANASNADLSGYTDTAFVDVNETDWFVKAVAWSADQGIVHGVTASTFVPNQIITREEMCVILARFIKLNSTSSEKFSDDASISDWAKDAVYACRESGIIAGGDNNTFAPKSPATRAQVSKILINYMEHF